MKGGQGVFPSVAEWLSISFWVTAALSRLLERFLGWLLIVGLGLLLQNKPYLWLPHNT